VKNVLSQSFPLFLCVVGALVGCASNERVKLAGPDQSGRSNPVTVVDRREQRQSAFTLKGSLTASAPTEMALSNRPPLSISALYRGEAVSSSTDAARDNATRNSGVLRRGG